MEDSHESLRPQELGFDGKVTILPGALEDLSAATYCILEEDHTLGNLLRWMLMKNPDVEFCGYSAPHPSEAKIHLRIQMYNHKSSLTALNEAIDNLEQLTDAIGEKYDAAVRAEDYETYEDPPIDFESVNQRLWAEKEAEGRGTYEEFLAKKQKAAGQDKAQEEDGAAGKAKKTSKSSSKAK